MEIKNENKKSKLIFDPKITRRLLKMNGEIKFCPTCGTRIEDGCGCHKNIVIDTKPYRNSETGALESDRSVVVFQNNEAFQNDLTQIIDEMKASKETEYEQMTFDDLA